MQARALPIRCKRGHEAREFFKNRSQNRQMAHHHCCSYLGFSPSDSCHCNCADGRSTSAQTPSSSNYFSWMDSTEFAKQNTESAPVMHETSTVTSPMLSAKTQKYWTGKEEHGAGARTLAPPPRENSTSPVVATRRPSGGLRTWLLSGKQPLNNGDGILITAMYS